MINFIIPVLIVLTYFLFRRLWFDLRKTRIVASIEKISIGVIQPNIILPEVSIRYKYYYGEGVYFGTGYILLQDFLFPYDYKAGFTLETFLLNQYELVSVFIDPVEPFQSEIEAIFTESIGVELK